MKNKNQLWGKVVLGVLLTLTMVLGGFSSKASAAITSVTRPNRAATVTVTKTGTERAGLQKISRTLPGKLTITNSAEGRAKVTVSMGYGKDDSSTGTSYKTPYLSSRDDGPKVTWIDDTKVSVILKKGESVTIDVAVDKETGKTDCIYNVFLSMSCVVEKNYNVSGDENKPVELAFGKKVEGPLYGEGLYKQYFKFTLQNAAEITGSFTGDTGTLELYSSGGYQKARVYADGKISCKLEPGTYYVTVMTAGENQIYFGKSYTIDFVKKDFNWGKVTFNQSLKNGIVSVKATLSGADSRAYISRVTLGTEYENNGGKAASVTVQHLDALLSAGYHTVTAHIDGGDFGTVERTFSYAKRPSAPTFDKTDLYVSTKSLQIKKTISEWDHIRVQLYKNKKWQNVNIPSNKIIKGLKPSTQYKIRLVKYVPASSEGPELTSKPSKTITFTTGSASKPAIKSVKISNIKRKKTKRQWIPGYWSGGKWTSGRYYGGNYVTTYKAKVTLKSNLKGKGVQGLCADLTNFKKGKGKTFTFNLSVTGKPKNTRIVFTSYTDSKMGGHCSSVVKKVKLK